MGIKYLWDTNTVIYYLQQQFPPSAEKFIDSILPDSQPAISVITEIELLCWKTATEKDIKFKTAELRKAYKIKLPDAIIAATALVYDLTLITRNVSDFKNIDELNVINPHEV